MILQIVGFKNSGKTTMMTYAVRFFKSLGYQVTTIKHHGHMGEEIELPRATLDHMKHFNAGADQSIVQGHAYMELVKRDNESTLETLIQDYGTIENNIILIEGYKQAQYDKVILYRNPNEYEQLKQLQNIVFEIDVSQSDDIEAQLKQKLKLWIENKGE
ncbi:molybdopterin-guanine dinucleotide biosynthesis protein B [Staphylococcus canis]|uniref:Molybdopterin-guanine dinucleotide biosynthesis protein B n=1 Tax=Staphylococcus canis TaxID=2724942 RepID=A0ABS0T7T4_9STAP|nr:molybdopterin-guanine dinucleotide biosynthesis protein B [Staphylococcus canis]MBI5974630.1 molybdopterin-guanine dinucleotide biosynthesis protein B [Staphylococcus canis]